MQVVEGRVLISPSDITSAAACEFAWLRSLDLRLGRIEHLPDRSDPLMARAADLGLLHEQRQLDTHISTFGPEGVVTIDSPRGDLAALTSACAETLEALQTKTPVVYQAAVQDKNLRGFADFIVLNDDDEYVVQDTKLARTAKVPALLQVAAYADILASQGIPVADHGILILGDGTESIHDLRTVIPVYRARRQALEDLVTTHLRSTDAAKWGDPSFSACGRCTTCAEAAALHKDLVLIAGMRLTQRAHLNSAGINTIDDLASYVGGVPGMSSGTLERLRRQAQLQIRQESEQDLPYEVIDMGTLSALPTPSPGDIFFDFEGDPMWQDPVDHTWGLEYLFGVIEANSGDFVHFWADDRRQD